MNKRAEGPYLLTRMQRLELNSVQRTMKNEMRTLGREMKKARERYLHTFLPILATYFDLQYEIYKNAEHGGGAGRFDVAQAFTLAGIKMDFRLAEELLDYACKKRKAFLIAEGGQGHDACYGSKTLCDKYMAKK